MPIEKVSFLPGQGGGDIRYASARNGLRGVGTVAVSDNVRRADQQDHCA